MNLSRIISGTMNWGSWGANYSSKEISELIRCAYENGINSFDHADIYGGYTTEEAFGKAFKLSGIEREKVIFISKCGIMYPCEKLQIDVKHYDYSKSHIIKSVENSLNNLNTDYLDSLLLHRPSPIMDINEIGDTIDYLMDKKMIKSFGVSNFTVSQMSLIEKHLKISFNQINFSLNVDVEHDLEVDPESVLSIVSYIYTDTDEEPLEVRHSLEELAEGIIEYYGEDLSRNGYGQMYVVGHELRRIAEQILSAEQLHEDNIIGITTSTLDDMEDDQYI